MCATDFANSYAKMLPWKESGGTAKVGLACILCTNIEKTTGKF
jgi:hypothetical protein